MNGEYISDFVEFCAYRDIDPETFLKILTAQDWAAGKDDWERSPAGVAAKEAEIKESGRQLDNLGHKPSWEEIQALLPSAMRRTHLHIVPPGL
jgi:hypothetical protein